ncbi:hypothetical protein IU418_26460 [Nocardia farcinica]|uniref:hypothetical protein n=1 Tax=Nocardia farcinica TaxID=37329 RepID=UPI001B3C58BE|nr:hypothetical protein [Nocardia farcinica]MBF6540754.1 hypothetical protein [Nocardia farcinica]
MGYYIYDYVNPGRVRADLKIPVGDSRVTLDIDWDASDFADTWCDVHRNRPAAVHVTYWRHDGDVAELAFSWGVAAEKIAEILADARVDDDAGIDIKVNAWFLVYALPEAVAA